MTTLEIDITNNLNKSKSLMVCLGGKTRLKILNLISNGQNWTITDMAKKMHCGVANLSQQVTELAKAGLITKQLSPMSGNNIKYIKPVYDKIEIKMSK